MKMRLDFVTNSSSTSYCILGVSIEDIPHFNWLSKITKKVPASQCSKCGAETIDRDDTYCRKCGSKLPSTEREGERDYEAMNKIAEAIRKGGLDIHCYEDSSSGYVGLDITKMKEDETLAQFKKRAATLLNKFFKDFGMTEKSLHLEIGEFTQHV